MNEDKIPKRCSMYVCSCIVLTKGYFTMNAGCIQEDWNVKMAVSVGNLVFIVIALVVISFQTFLFLNLGNQLNICLKRIEHLEELLKNATTTLRSKKHKLTSRKDILENEMNYELPADYSLKMTLLQSRHKISKSKQR